MQENKFARYLERLADLDRLQARYLTELRALRNRFFAEFPMVEHIGDAQWVEIFWSIHEMWENSPRQEIQRLAEKLPLPEEPPARGAGSASSPLCRICGFPLSGRQRMYCSESCKKKAKRLREKSRR